jgi:hypothetical protein
VNTTYYWEGKLGVLAFPAFLILAIVYLGLFVILLRQLYLVIKETFKHKHRLILIGVLTVVLILTFYKPFGLINFDKLEGNDLLLAEREGVANCITTIKLKDDFTFREKNVCFGVSEVKGKYRISNDTIYFDNIKRGKEEDELYKFGVIEKLEYYTENPYALVLYKNLQDTIGFKYFITKNELKIQALKKPNR